MRLAGVVVLYNPCDTVVNNIATYVSELDVLYIVDNSENINYKVIENVRVFPNVRYICNNGNKGIAYAQNIAARKATKEKYEWLLTMDQDSMMTDNALVILKNYIDSNNTERIGIVSAFQETESEKSRIHTMKVRQVSWVISSGNIINLKIYKEVGGFLNKLFIDSVDFEYCLRLKKYGYKIVVLNNAIIKHKLGEAKKIEGRYVHLHHYKRMYYRVRNTFYIRKIYRSKCPELMESIFNMSLSSWKNDILYGDHRFKQLFFMCKGYIDYLRGNFN